MNHSIACCYDQSAGAHGQPSFCLASLAVFEHTAGFLVKLEACDQVLIEASFAQRQF